MRPISNGARMFEGKSYVFWLGGLGFQRTALDTSSRVSILQRSGAGRKSEGHIIIKPVGSERKTLPIIPHLFLIFLFYFLPRGFPKIVFIKRTHRPTNASQN